MISVVVVTKNEADKLKDCLQSVKDFSSEIVIVDLESTDGIKDVAKQFDAKLLTHKPVEYVEIVREYAISLTRNEWVLVLDPDERIPETLGKELMKLANQSEHVAFNIPRKNIFFGKWIAHTNFWPDRQIRFFKKKSVQWPKIIHTYPVIEGKIFALPAEEKLAIEHYGYASFSEFISRQKRYARVEAANRLASGRGFSVRDLFWEPLRELLARLIKHQGYLDGLAGIFLVVGLMWYRCLIQYYLLKARK